MAICLPALIFPDQLPAGLALLSLAGLALLAVVGYVVVRSPTVRTPVDLPIWALLLLSPVSLLIAIDSASTLPQLYKVVAGVALFYGVVGWASERPESLSLAPWGICAAGAVLTMLVFTGAHWTDEYTGLLRDLLEFVSFRFRPFWKEEGYLGFNVNMAAGILAMLLPAVLCYVAMSSEQKHRRGALRALPLRVVAAVVGVLMFAVLLLTRSWGALLGLVCAIAAMLIARHWRWAVPVGIVALGVPLLLMSHSTLASSEIVNAIAADVSTSAGGRLELWSRAIYMMQDFPFTGIGMGSVRAVLPLLYPTFRIPVTTPMDHLHSIYLNTGAEMGVLGLVALCAFLIGLLAFSWQALRHGKRSGEAPLVLGMFGMVIVFCVHGVTDAITYYPRAHLIVWALFGVAVAANMDHLHTETKDGVDALQTHRP
jgi:putative inorganic carbon (hco3(-)) transporter